MPTTDPKTADYRVQRERLRHNGNRLGQGDKVALTARQAAPLLQVGAIAPIDAEPAADFTPAEPAQGVVAVEHAPAPAAPAAPAKPKPAKPARPAKAG